MDEIGEEIKLKQKKPTIKKVIQLSTVLAKII